MKLLAAIVMGILLVPSAAYAAFDVDLRYGSSGAAVFELQEFLTAQGVYTGPITGNFYSLTLAGVKAFQTKEGVQPVSGFFGPITRGKANTLLAVELQESDAEASTTPPVVTSDKPKTTSTSSSSSSSNDEENNNFGSAEPEPPTVNFSVDVTEERDEHGYLQANLSLNSNADMMYLTVTNPNGEKSVGGSPKSGYTSTIDVIPGTYTWEVRAWKGGNRTDKAPDFWEGGTKVTETGTFMVE